MRAVLTSILITFLISNAAQARWAQPSEIGSILDLWSVDVKVAKDGSVDATYQEIWTIQTEEGKDRHSLISIFYTPPGDQMEILEAFTQNGRTRHPVPAASIEEKDSYEARDFDPTKARNIAFPALQIGSKIHLKYRIRSQPQFPGRWSWYFGLLPENAVRRARLRVDSELPLHTATRGPKNGFRIKVGRKGDRQILEAEATDLVRGSVVGEKEVYFHPDRTLLLLISSQKEWKDYFSKASSEYEEVLTAKPAASYAAWIKRFQKLATTEEKMSRVLEAVSSEFRYFGDWRRYRGGFIPRGLAEVQESLYGDCKDLSVFVSRTLRDLGIRAHPALIRRGDNPWVEEPPLDTLPAHASAFNHVVVRAETGDKVYWLDPTNKVVSLRPLADVAGRSALVLYPGQPRLERLPAVNPERDWREYETTYYFRGNTLEKARGSVVYHGLNAVLTLHDLISLQDGIAVHRVLDELAFGREITRHRSLKVPEKSNRRLRDLEFEFEYETPAAVVRTQLGPMMFVGGGWSPAGFYETADRASDLKLTTQLIPIRFRETSRFRGVKAKGEPIDCAVKSRWADGSLRTEFAASDVIVREEFWIRQPVVKQEDFRGEEFKRFQREVRECFYRRGMVF